ncbi:MAG: 30S ribosomal protein S1 [Ignavibacteria bacterium]|jgi:small subunit ribosomal protein S1|nr:30S ribosomal protein S1 [Ignavibacteria bacterium]
MAELETEISAMSNAGEEKRKQLNQIFDELKEKHEKNENIEVEITSLTKGGFKVDYKDLTLFLPFRLFSKNRNLSEEELSKEIGKTIKVAIIDFVEDEFVRDVRISRVKVINDELWKDIEVGKTVSGKVKAIIPQGIIFDLGGLEGFAHISKLSKNRVENIEDFAEIGETFNATIISADQEKNRISLSLRDYMHPRFASILDSLVVGEKIKGKVVNIIPNGTFVEIAKGLSGFIKNSELSWLKRSVKPEELFTIGQEIETEILGVNKEEAKINLSYRRAVENNWAEIANKYSENIEYVGVVTSVKQNGVTVLLNEEIEGFMPKGRMRALMNGNKITVKERDIVNVKIVEKDAEKHSMIFESAIVPVIREEISQNDEAVKAYIAKNKRNSAYSLGELLSEESKENLMKSK